MAQKIDSEAHRPIPMVSPRIVSHIAFLVQRKILSISPDKWNEKGALEETEA
jgi:hypothetical protein